MDFSAMLFFNPIASALHSTWTTICAIPFATVYTLRLLVLAILTDAILPVLNPVMTTIQHVLLGLVAVTFITTFVLVTFLLASALQVGHLYHESRDLHLTWTRLYPPLRTVWLQGLNAIVEAGKITEGLMEDHEKWERELETRGKMR
ncbi:hypothetical protein CAC42_6135 [Sphaceloma murrayae]|uniref:Uncharacterized protein n=1 Tax=Sphaceloma murrayae TaxID=2082308 RepID=A0A2K1QTC3_9PEZI|nr:hypothetical protein CAC42_6135 [Sphaceloma murrayae]